MLAAEIQQEARQIVVQVQGYGLASIELGASIQLGADSALPTLRPGNHGLGGSYKQVWRTSYPGHQDIISWMVSGIGTAGLSLPASFEGKLVIQVASERLDTIKLSDSQGTHRNISIHVEGLRAKIEVGKVHTNQLSVNAPVILGLRTERGFVANETLSIQPAILVTDVEAGEINITTIAALPTRIVDSVCAKLSIKSHHIAAPSTIFVLGCTVESRLDIDTYLDHVWIDNLRGLPSTFDSLAAAPVSVQTTEAIVIKGQRSDIRMNEAIANKPIHVTSVGYVHLEKVNCTSNLQVERQVDDATAAQAVDAVRLNIEGCVVGVLTAKTNSGILKLSKVQIESHCYVEAEVDGRISLNEVLLGDEARASSLSQPIESLFRTDRGQIECRANSPSLSVVANLPVRFVTRGGTLSLHRIRSRASLTIHHQYLCVAAEEERANQPAALVRMTESDCASASIYTESAGVKVAHTMIRGACTIRTKQTGSIEVAKVSTGSGASGPYLPSQRNEACFETIAGNITIRGLPAIAGAPLANRGSGYSTNMLTRIESLSGTVDLDRVWSSAPIFITLAQSQAIDPPQLCLSSLDLASLYVQTAAGGVTMHDSTIASHLSVSAGVKPARASGPVHARVRFVGDQQKTVFIENKHGGANVVFDDWHSTMNVTSTVLARTGRVGGAPLSAFAFETDHDTSRYALRSCLETKSTPFEVYERGAHR